MTKIVAMPLYMYGKTFSGTGGPISTISARNVCHIASFLSTA